MVHNAKGSATQRQRQSTADGQELSPHKKTIDALTQSVSCPDHEKGAQQWPPRLLSWAPP